jgi:hypothetical protein
VRLVEPEDIADAIVAAVRKPRLHVWVPRSLGPITYVNSLLPRRLREGAARLLKADTVFIDFDSRERAAYEERVSH